MCDPCFVKSEKTLPFSSSRKNKIYRDLFCLLQYANKVRRTRDAGGNFLKNLNFKFRLTASISTFTRKEEKNMGKNILFFKENKPTPAGPDNNPIQKCSSSSSWWLFFAIHSILSWTCTNKKWRRLMWNWRFCLLIFFPGGVQGLFFCHLNAQE